MSALQELVGFKCEVEMNDPDGRWTRQYGCPCWFIVAAVDMPLVKVTTTPGGKGFWINAADIRTVRAFRFIGPVSNVVQELEPDA